MRLAAAPALEQAPLWYATRSSGVVAFLLLTLSVVLGLAATRRALASPAWPRFATQALHRNVSALALVLLALHVGTTLVDDFVQISWWSIVVPGVSSYARLGVALGTVALDLLLAVVLTSVLRQRVPHGLWRGVHLSSYLLWPAALAHFLLTGTDAGRGSWGWYLGLACGLVVLAAAGARVVTGDGVRQPARSVGPS